MSSTLPLGDPSVSASAPAQPGAARTLMEVIRKAVGDVAFERVVKWLAQELEDEQYARLEQAGHKQEDRIPLSKVFIDLEVLDSPSESMRRFLDKPTRLIAQLCSPRAVIWRPKVKGVKGAADIHGPNVPNVSDDEAQAERFAQRRSKNSSVDGHVIIGGPGQGKSTVGQLLCQLHRAWLLFCCIERCETEIQKQTIATFTNEVAQRDLGCPAELCFPVRIVLAEAAAWLAMEPAPSTESEAPALLRFVANRVRRDKFAPNAADLAAILGSVDWLLVLDGLDEVPGTSDRMLVIKAIEELLVFLQPSKSRGLLIATTRPQGYTDEFASLSLARMHTHYLALLSREQAWVYAERLVATRYPVDRREIVLHRLSLAAAGETTSRLMGTPLQVTILATLVDHIGRAPNERWTLFKEYYRVMYEREMERDTFAAELLRDYRGYVDRIHTHVGLLLQTEAERSGGTASVMSPTRFRQIVDAVLSEDEMDGARREVLANRLVEAARHRLVFLVEPQPDKLGFEIRSIQEYMAAWALAQKSETIVEERIRQIAKASSFRNVVIFLASKAFAELSDLRDAFTDHICPALNEDSDDVLARITLAGSRLALEILEDGAPLKQAKYVRKLVELAVKLLTHPPDPVHARVIRACLSDAEAVIIALPILQRVIETGLQSEVLVQKLGAWTGLLTLVAQDNAWAVEIANVFWLKESEVRRQIFDLVRHAEMEMSPWLVQRVIEAPEEFGPRAISSLFTPSFFGSRQVEHKLLKQEPKIAALLAMHRDPPLRIPWVTEQFEVSVGYVRLIEKYVGTRLDVLCNPKEPVPSWAIVGAAARFIGRPSPETLGESLEIIAKNFEPRTIAWISDRVPWPLKVCLDVASTADDLHRLSQKAAVDELGTLEDWQAAEEKGIATAIPAASGLPFDTESLAKGLPLEAAKWSADWSEVPDLDAAIIVQELQNVFHATASIKLRSAIADDLLERIVWDLDNPGATIGVATLQEIADVASSIPFEVIDIHLSQDGFDPRWGELVDSLGKSGAISYEHYLEHYAHEDDGLPDTVNGLVSLYRAHPHLHGLICILDDLVTNIDSGTIPKELLVPERFSDPDIREAAGWLMARQGYLSDAETESLIARCIQRGGIRRVLSPRNLSNSDIQALLAMAQQYVRPDDVTTSRVIHDKALEAFSTNLSGLDEPSTWDRLRLPMPYPTRPSRSDRPPPDEVKVSAVKLQSITLENLRIFDQFVLGPLAQPDNGSGQWIVLLGENGTGKTTLLRSLVFALLDVKSQPNKLPKSSFSSKTPWRRLGIEDHETAKVRVTLTHRVYQSEIRVAPDRLEKERLYQEPTSQHHEPAYSFPFYGYGCRRGSALGGGANNPDDTPGAEVYTLFDEGANLIDAEVWLLLRQNLHLQNPDSEAGRVYLTILEVLKEVLGFESIEGRNGQIWVKGKSVGEMPLGVLSDGYLTTMGWVVDLIARWVKRAELQREKIPEKFNLHMTGLVLVDELDLHLHPAWQMRVIGDIRKAFPRMSFIVTTHHPLTLLGARAEEIWKLEYRNGRTVAVQGRENPALMTGSDILDAYFGIDSVFPDELGQWLDRYGYLARNPVRSVEEDAEAHRLLDALKGRGVDPGYEPIPRVEG